MLLQAGQFQQEPRAAVAEVNQCERAVRRLFPVMLFQAQRLFVKGDATLQVGNVYIEMVGTDYRSGQWILLSLLAFRCLLGYLYWLRR